MPEIIPITVTLSGKDYVDLINELTLLRGAVQDLPAKEVKKEITIEGLDNLPTPKRQKKERRKNNNQADPLIDRESKNGKYFVPSDQTILNVMKERPIIWTTPMLITFINNKKLSDKPTAQYAIFNALNRLIAQGLIHALTDKKPFLYSIGGINSRPPEHFQLKRVRRPKTAKKKEKGTNSKKVKTKDPLPPTKINPVIQYATDLERLQYAKDSGYLTIEEAIKDVGSWEFERRIKQWKSELTSNN